MAITGATRREQIQAKVRPPVLQESLACGSAPRDQSAQIPMVRTNLLTNQHLAAQPGPAKHWWSRQAMAPVRDLHEK